MSVKQEVKTISLEESLSSYEHNSSMSVDKFDSLSEKEEQSFYKGICMDLLKKSVEVLKSRISKLEKSD